MVNSMAFERHPSADLVRLFQDKPYQGQVPEKASIIFLSSDANYSPDISSHHFFNNILEYHQDGVSFWQKQKVHHPFLLSLYPFHKGKGGRVFHRNFSKLGLTPSYADHVSFLELLDIPTIGNSSENPEAFFDLISVNHLKKIDHLICSGDHRLVFVASGVLNKMLILKQRYDVFNWLPNKIPKNGLVYKTRTTEVRKIYHFSSSHIHNQIEEIRDTIDQWLSG